MRRSDAARRREGRNAEAHPCWNWPSTAGRSGKSAQLGAVTQSAEDPHLLVLRLPTEVSAPLAIRSKRIQQLLQPHLTGSLLALEHGPFAQTPRPDR